MCSQYLATSDTTAQIIMVAQELLENLVKYSREGRSCIDFELYLDDDQPSCRITTRNNAELCHVAEVQGLIARVSNSDDPRALYDAMVASSGEREGSGLGLVRIRAEAGLFLSQSVQGSNLYIVASGPVQAKESSP